ncbi:cyclic pyranopterin monophosphate synthase MoaC [Litorimonas sp. RW-G-Af-16]|uniref:cyclic pyranopterin monophosphate synthase MoaC n=1 Tax=Litorimonas sp. RW-G-Af-16 TaxID=3241168 RepID=UPI00390C6D7E
MSDLTHFDKDGRATMVDVGSKQVTQRRALASGQVIMARDTLQHLGANKKGDVVTIAELAGIMSAKKTADLIPLCHPLPLSKVHVSISVDPDLPGLKVKAETKTAGQTGVEMEALTAVSVACLTIYDMLKAVDKHMVIGEIKLLEKQGGKSGDWTRRKT